MVEVCVATSKPNKLLAKMTPALLEEYKIIQKKLAVADDKDVRSRHALGVLVMKVRCSPKKYGTSAVTQLEKALGLDEATLYRHAQVAEAWSKKEVGLLLKKANKFGLPLSWSHLVLLSTVTKPERNKYVTVALAEGLSVRKLKELMDGRATNGTRTQADEPASVTTAVYQLTKRARTFLDAREELEVSVFKPLSEADVMPPPPGLVASLEKAMEVHLQLKEECERVITRVEDGIARLTEKVPPKMTKARSDDTTGKPEATPDGQVDSQR